MAPLRPDALMRPRAGTVRGGAAGVPTSPAALPAFGRSSRRHSRRRGVATAAQAPGLDGLVSSLASAVAQAAGPSAGSPHDAARAGELLQQLQRQLNEVAIAADAAAAQVSQRDDGWLAPIANALEAVLSATQSGLNQLHVPYSYGWSIILLTLFTKVLTFPFTKIQVESAISVQKLKPTVDAIKRQYGDDKDKVQRETSALYEKAGVNPLAGCGPTLATIPVFWGLYRTLSNVASDGLLTEGFYWIPSLSGPITVEQQRAGSGLSWLWPLAEGQPPIGWEGAARYLVLPVLLVVFQFVSTAIISPPVSQQPEEEQGQAVQKALSVGLPFLVGWFALNLPAGLSLYYFSNITLTSAQQIWLRKLGGANAFEWKQEIGINQARRTGQPLALAAAGTSEGMTSSGAEAASSSGGAQQAQEQPQEQAQAAEAGPAMAAAGAVPDKQAEMEALLARRCKRKKASLAGS